MGQRKVLEVDYRGEGITRYICLNCTKELHYQYLCAGMYCLFCGVRWDEVKQADLAHLDEKRTIQSKVYEREREAQERLPTFVIEHREMEYFADPSRPGPWHIFQGKDYYRSATDAYDELKRVRKHWSDNGEEFRAVLRTAEQRHRIKLGHEDSF